MFTGAIHVIHAFEPATVSLVPEASSLVPDRDIQYQGSHIPQWKKIWDQARSFSRQEKYEQALVQYELLFLQKENITEAIWEYVSILLHLQRWQQANLHLPNLISRESENRGYLLAQARVYMETGQIDRAVDMYGNLYARMPDSADAIEALIKEKKECRD